MTSAELVALVALAISLGSLALSVWVRVSKPRGSVEEIRSDVDELAISLERIAKAHNRERMQRVRAAQKTTESDPATMVPASSSTEVGAQDYHSRKAAIRARFRAAQGAS